jgi:hypothetical protein
MKIDFKGAQVYEDDDFFRGFLNCRNREESPDNVLEKPVIMELSGSGKIRLYWILAVATGGLAWI